MSFMINECSVVFPLYNEQNRVQKLVDQLVLDVDSNSKNYEIIFVLDGCVDKTFEYLTQRLKNNSTLSHTISVLETNLGKGGAIRYGFSIAKYDNLAFLDADLSIGIEDLSNALEKFKNISSAGLLVAQRQNVLQNKGHLNQQRRWASFFFRWLVSKLFFEKIIDTQAPLKIVRREKFKKVENSLKEKGYLFDIELYLEMKKNNFQIIEYPVLFWLNKDESKIRLFRDSVKMLKGIFVLKYRYMKK
ncbi:MAG TPA: glycosyltransferase family 2 protein [Oligoflexia bacterium]|nr:glycosyltransferase family 2 protein [Oligoflexia bacterium]HMR25708.1 glycosyltransferase family 2 protein [Oligoflexia bacterium]